ncbi:MAG: ATP-binding protein, partial [Ktedonobacteraceae bacterium]
MSNETGATESQISAEGFRLERLEIYNWGTFGQRIWSINPASGTALLTGANGSGKSTLVDALLTLLVPLQRRSYNLASGTEKTRERDERSYILGAWGKQKNVDNNLSHSQYLRQPDTHSVLLAVFINGATQQVVTLAQVLWIEDVVRKLFVVAPSTLSIDEHFRFQGASADLRKQLRAYGAEVFQEFAAYGRRFRQMMGFRSEKALDLFNQIVSIKEIGGLNTFVRDHMLEKTDAQARIKQLRDNFENLTKAHESIQVAERQLTILEPLMQDAQKYEEQQARINEANHCTELLNVYIASRRKTLAEQVIRQAQQRLT